MKIGFYSAVFPDLSIEEVADWGAGEGFNCLEIDFNRHIVDSTKIEKVVGTVRQAGLEVSSITLFGTLLTSDRSQQERIRETAQNLVLAASAAEVFATVFFSGRDESLSAADNYESLADFLKLLEEKSSPGATKILLENWPGFHKNSIATTPQGWRTLFARLESTRIGLEFDPSHLLIQGIESLSAYAEIQERVFLIHVKDAKLHPERVQSEGYYGAWWNYRLPGLGDLDWNNFLGTLKRSQYSGPLIIEHEDFEFGFPAGDLELRKDGLRRSRELLCRGLI
jgi:sugar phosphate isomerase/epimerase